MTVQTPAKVAEWRNAPNIFIKPEIGIRKDASNQGKNSPQIDTDGHTMFICGL